MQWVIDVIEFERFIFEGTGGDLFAYWTGKKSDRVKPPVRLYCSYFGKLIKE